MFVDIDPYMTTNNTWNIFARYAIVTDDNIPSGYASNNLQRLKFSIAKVKTEYSSRFSYIIKHDLTEESIKYKKIEAKS
jgi:hypothetical protein